MKKVLLCALVAFAFTQVGRAQYGSSSTTPTASITTDAGTFVKPTAGTKIMEVNLTPDLTGGGIFSLPAINNGLGMIGLKMRDFKSDKLAYRYSANVSISDSNEPNTETEFAIGLGFGVENHLKGAERLSTYWGYEINAGMTQANASYGGKDQKFGVGVGAFTGFDYYIMPKIYLGTELGYNWALTCFNPEIGKNVTRFEFAPGITPSLRLGWQF